jgi:hypothetical protein
MATNLYFSQKVRSEQNLYEDIIIESLKMYGTDIYYLPRDLVNVDEIFNEDVVSKFNSSHKIEMYIENVEGFDGEGDLFTKFGVQIRDAATFIVARRRWTQVVKRYDNEITSVRPLEGDLIYLPLTNKLFEVMHVEHEQPFYQLSNLPTYKLRCELFEYSGEDLDTGIEAIDGIEDKGYTVDLTLEDSSAIGFVVGNTVSQTLSSGVTITGEITKYNDPLNILSVTHIGSDDDAYHAFAASVDITSVDSDGNAIRRTVSAVNEQLPVNSDNTFYDDIDFLDFTESNPFGDPS